MLSKQDTKPEGTVQLRECVVGTSSIRPHCIVLTTTGTRKTYYACAASENEMQGWLKVLAGLIHDLNPTASPTVTRSPIPQRLSGGLGTRPGGILSRTSTPHRIIFGAHSDTEDKANTPPGSPHGTPPGSPRGTPPEAASPLTLSPLTRSSSASSMSSSSTANLFGDGLESPEEKVRKLEKEVQMLRAALANEARVRVELEQKLAAAEKKLASK